MSINPLIPIDHPHGMMPEFSITAHGRPIETLGKKKADVPMVAVSLRFFIGAYILFHMAGRKMPKIEFFMWTDQDKAMAHFKCEEIGNRN